MLAMKTLFVLLVWSALVTTICASIRSSLDERRLPADKNRSQLFGISVRKQTIHLVRSVENLYGKPLCVALYKNKSDCGTLTGETVGDPYGSASVSLEGSPVILLAEKRRNESTLVHELFHLKLTAEGYPTLEYHVDYNLKPDVVNLIVLVVSTALEHRVFYGEMRKMGLDPDEFERRELDDLISGKTASTAVVSDVQVKNRAAGYFRTAIECGAGCKREKTMDRLSSWYEAKGWDASLTAARQLIDLVESKPTDSPKALTDTTFACVSKLLTGQVVITSMEWKSERRGKIIQNVAPYRASLQQ